MLRSIGINDRRGYDKWYGAIVAGQPSIPSFTVPGTTNPGTGSDVNAMVTFPGQGKIHSRRQLRSAAILVTRQHLIRTARQQFLPIRPYREQCRRIRPFRRLYSVGFAFGIALGVAVRVTDRYGNTSSTVHVGATANPSGTWGGVGKVTITANYGMRSRRRLLFLSTTNR